MSGPPPAPQSLAGDSTSSWTMDFDTRSSTAASFINIPDVDAEAPSPEEKHPFRDARVAFAVDISGSTAGEPLAAEKLFITSIGQQLSPHARLLARILPWSTSAGRITSLSNVGSLTSEGGTVPSVILQDPSQRRTLAQSSVWFLMTDGLIDQFERLRFARILAEHGLHGTSCVIVIFNSPTHSPWSGDISVGVGVYAVVPNCAFVLYDVSSGDMRLLQAKGLFRCLLKGREPPVFDQGADLTTFPLVTPTDFCDVVAIMPKKLELDEVALQNSQVVNMEDLYANRLGAAEVESILSNEDNLSSIVMTSQSRGQSARFQGWIQQQRMEPKSSTTSEREDVGGKAQKAFGELMTAQQQNQPLPLLFQVELQAAHSINLQEFDKKFREMTIRSRERNRTVESAHKRSQGPIHSAMSLTPTRDWGEEDADKPTMKNRSTPSSRYYPTVPRMATAIMPPTMPPMAIQPGPPMSTMPRLATDYEVTTSLGVTQNFRPGTGAFRDTCPLCLTEDTIMSLLFKRPPNTMGDVLTQNQMGTMERRPSLYLGCSNQFNILSSIICCDACAFLYTKLGRSSDSKETIYACLPVVPRRDNTIPFDRALPLIFGAHMANHNQYELLLAVVLMALGRKDLSPVLKAALTWMAKHHLQNTPSTWGEGHYSTPPKSLGTIMQEALTPSIGPLLLTCDAYTFALTLRGAGLLGTGKGVRLAAMLMRFVYSVGEGLFFYMRFARLPKKDGRANAVKTFFRYALWKSSDDNAPRHPVLHVSPLGVGVQALMVKGTFERLQQADEFQEIVELGHAVALLLHTLARIATCEDSPAELPKMFEVFEEDVMVCRAISSPQQISEEDVEAAAM
ncbi:hypothetical protein F5X68DRAFT_260467 [Plectosphaerella plurivora]|uniref:Uncharacterized protein n=1 Tax=Plectosphaerella plurivora TaxID=936078 RepID=A0A9P9ADR3_9PEZI|nr:hypothetical protein F5X68DRAFT_260467 [Plectosphaerella plurivora]